MSDASLGLFHVGVKDFEAVLNATAVRDRMMLGLAVKFMSMAVLGSPILESRPEWVKHHIDVPSNHVDPEIVELLCTGMVDYLTHREHVDLNDVSHVQLMHDGTVLSLVVG